MIKRSNIILGSYSLVITCMSISFLTRTIFPFSFLADELIERPVIGILTTLFSVLLFYAYLLILEIVSE